MTTLTHDAFEGLLTNDFALFDDSLPQLELTGEINTVVANDWNDNRETIIIGDVSKSFNTRIKFRDPILSSAILRSTVTQNAPEGRIDFNATIVAHRDFEIQVGDEWLTMEAFAAAAIKSSSPTAANASDETILHQLAQYGWDQSARLPMYLQHLGAGEQEFAEIKELLMSLGAYDNTDEVKARSRGTKSTVMSSVRHREGIPVSQLEISKANRGLSLTNSGFIGFLDGSWNTLLKVLAAHRTRIGLKQIIENPKSNDAQKAAAAAQETQIRNLFQVATSARAFRNWGGTSEVKDVLDANAPSSFYAQQVPCGRLTIAGNHTLSVWTTSNKTGATTVPTANLDDVTPMEDVTTF